MGAKKRPAEKESTNNNEDKLVIKQLVELINKKLSQKELAKKAAMILTEWINKK